MFVIKIIAIVFLIILGVSLLDYGVIGWIIGILLISAGINIMGKIKP
jgi:hypothetical protein